MTFRPCTVGVVICAVGLAAWTNTLGGFADFDQTGSNAAKVATSPDPEIDALIARAEASQTQNDNRRALELFEQALTRIRAQGNAAGEARALSGMASAYERVSDYPKSVQFFEQALRLYRSIGDRKGEAAALAGIGGARVRMNQYGDARTILNEALPIYRTLGDRAGEASALQSIGYASFSQDEYSTAIDVYNQALTLARGARAQGLEASVVYNLGQVYYHLGAYQEALDLYADALGAHRALGNRSGEAAALSALGRVYRFLADYQKSLDYHRQALTIQRAIGERMNEATTLNNSAHVHLSMGEYRQALPLFEASLAICVTAGNRSGEASNTNGIGLVHAGLHEYDTALTYHREALRMFRAIGHKRAEADSLGHIGRAYEGQGDYQRARANLQDALAIYRAIRVPRQESETLFAIARLATRLGDFAAATDNIDAAIRLAEGFRHDVASQQLRTSYQGTLRDFYELKIDSLMQMHTRSASEGFDARALEASERARARSLLDLLAEAHADIRGNVDPVLLERERTLRQQLAGRAERQTQLVGSNAPAEQLAAIARAIDADLDQYQNVLTQLRARSPQYAALMQPEPLSLAEMQTDVLDEDTLLLEYFLGTERSYLWAITRNSRTAYQLPPRAELETAARRFYELLGAGKASADRERAARTLSDMVLAPVADRLGDKRLAIVADGALHYVPFAALPEPRPNGANGIDQPLIVHHEVVSLPSASTLAVLRREPRVPAEKLVAVVADPVFDAGDVRVRRKTQTSPVSTAVPSEHISIQRSFETVDAGQSSWPLPRLLGTRREARAILALAPSRARREALDFEASRQTAISGALGGFQVVHFATHALINNQYPELSGLVLSLVDADGRAQDGFLRLNDIYNLRLPAELVVLSACRTGVGKEMRGEGLVGLTRGFMYAGAPRVITSLWQVDDAGTSELMSRFYRALLAGNGVSPAAALRQAQIEMWRHTDWQSPYYWAAFALQGEWQSVRTDRARR